MRLLFTGATWWCNTGYSKPLRYLLPRLGKMGHELGLCAFYGYQGESKEMDCYGTPVRVFGVWQEKFFNDTIEIHARGFKADAVISLQDVWALDKWGKRGFRWLPWMPVDTWPVPAPDRQALEGAHAPLSYSKWGQERLVEAGFKSARYVPFGVDLDLHQPMDRGHARRKAGLPRDGLLFGMIAANSSYPSRKSFPEVLQAFRRFLDGGGDGRLYIHASISPRRANAGIHLDRLLDTLGLQWSTIDDPDEAQREKARVLFPSQHRLICEGYTDLDLVHLYNSFNLLLEPSMAEGFGIPILEAQACGTPVATLNVTSMPELTFGGYGIEPRQLYWHDRGGWRGSAGVADLVHVMEHAAGGEGQDEARRRALEGVVPYSWDNVVSRYWVPLLQELADGA